MQNKNSQKSQDFRGTKLHQTYQQLSETQRKRFRQYLDSPYHNTSRRLRAAWKTFERYAQSSKSTLTLLGFFKKLHPDRYPSGRLSPNQQQSIEQQVRQINSAIWIHLRSFMALEVYQERTLEQNVHTFEGLMRLQVSGGYRDFQIGFMNDQLAKASMSLESLYLRHRLNAFELSLQHTHHNQPQREVFEAAVHALDEYHFTQRLFYELEHLTLRSRFDQASSISSFEQLLKVHRPYIEQYNELARGGYYLYQALVAPNALSHLDNLLLLLQKDQSRLEESALRNLATGALNLLIRYHQTMPEQFQERLADQYVLCLEKEWICIDGKVEVRHFNNLINILLQEQRVQQAEALFETWKTRLNSSQPMVARLFNQGLILDQKGELAEATACFHKVYNLLNAEDDFLFDVKVRQMLLKMYYLQQNWEDFQYRQQVFTQYFRNHRRLSKGHKTAALAYAKALNRLYRLRTSASFTSEELNQLRQTISKQPRPAMRSWLLQEIDRLSEK